MKKIFIALATCATLGTSFAVNAADHSVTLGYAESKIYNYKMKGVNVKYRFEWDSPVSVITSMTIMGSNNQKTSPATPRYLETKSDLKINNLSFAAGPAYRINDYISIYGLMGININKAKVDYKAYDSRNNLVKTGNFIDQKYSNLMYGAGVQLNPMPNLVVDLGYEGSHTKGTKEEKININGFVIGAGYRF